MILLTWGDLISLNLIEISGVGEELKADAKIEILDEFVTKYEKEKGDLGKLPSEARRNLRRAIDAAIQKHFSAPRTLTTNAINQIEVALEKLNHTYVQPEGIEIEGCQTKKCASSKVIDYFTEPIEIDASEVIDTLRVPYRRLMEALTEGVARCESPVYVGDQPSYCPKRAWELTLDKLISVLENENVVERRFIMHDLFPEYVATLPAGTDIIHDAVWTEYHLGYPAQLTLDRAEIAKRHNQAIERAHRRGLPALGLANQATRRVAGSPKPTNGRRIMRLRHDIGDEPAMRIASTAIEREGAATGHLAKARRLQDKAAALLTKGIEPLDIPRRLC